MNSKLKVSGILKAKASFYLIIFLTYKVPPPGLQLSSTQFPWEVSPGLLDVLEQVFQVFGIHSQWLVQRELKIVEMRIVFIIIVYLQT